VGHDDLGNICGLGSFAYDSAGALELCIVKVNMFYDDMNCTRVTSTITHEIGYCIGVFKHTTDGGLIDENANGSREIISTITVILGLLYTIAPGTASVTNCSPDVPAARIS
jgi:hypothetical protein